jgi:hypothetical protein
LQVEHDDEVIQKMSKLIGLFLFNLPLDKQRKENAQNFVDFFLMCNRSKDEVVRKNAAFNLPCFFYYFGNYEHPEDLLDFPDLYSQFS